MMKQHEFLASTVDKLARAVELRDTYTGEHSRRVTLFALLLGQQLALSAEDVALLRLGAPLHDLGKIGIEDAILRKPGTLTPEEFKVMQTHTTQGAAILAKIPGLAGVVPIVRSHHERWDGRGYPDGLKGDEIPRLARIVAVANAFDAMTFDTPYRPGRPTAVAFAEIARQQGQQFDPEVVQALLQLGDQVVEAMHQFENNKG